MKVRALVSLLALLGGGGCFKAWESEGPWACDQGACPDGYTCDDGVCCKPDGTPRCPTLPYQGTCPLGSTPAVYYRDQDRDGAGARDTGRPFCRAPVQESWVADAGDCSDTDPAVGPLATERCNAEDDDCDGVIDDGLVLQAWFKDVDGDGFGEDCGGCRLEACAQPRGYAPRGGDCDPLNPDVFPGAPESCNGIDDNCNGPVDDPPFSDVDNPPAMSQANECTTGQAGECGLGGLQCVFSSATLRFEKTCVPRKLPSTDVCGNGLNDDCAGGADDRPGCGGPASLLTQAGVTVFAVALPFGDGGVPDGCVSVTAGERMAWLNPSWIGTRTRPHVLSFDAAPGTWWDLTTATTIVLPLTSSFVGDNVTSAWDDPTRPVNPIVQLCGEDGGVQRYLPTAANNKLAMGTQRVQVPLRPGPGGGWSASNPGFDLSRVRQLQLILSPRVMTAVTFTNRFATDAGIVGFQ